MNSNLFIHALALTQTKKSNINSVSIKRKKNVHKENKFISKLNKLEYREKDLTLKERKLVLREREAKIRVMELTNLEKEHELIPWTGSMT